MSTTTHAEMETLILINRQDSKDGFFTFSTTNRNDYERLIKRIGGVGELRSLDVSKSRGKVVQWIAKVPIRFYSLRAFSVRPASRVVRSEAAVQKEKAAKEGNPSRPAEAVQQTEHVGSL
jgi:hypothetical protein